MDATHATMTILHFIHQLISCNVCMAWSNISSTSKWSLISYAKKKGTSTSPQKRNIFNSPNALPKNMRSPCEASSISSARFQRSTFWCNKQSEKISQPLSSFEGFLKDLARDLLKSLSGRRNWLFCSRSHMKLRARSFVIMNHIRFYDHAPKVIEAKRYFPEFNSVLFHLVDRFSLTWWQSTWCTSYLDERWGPSWGFPKVDGALSPDTNPSTFVGHITHFNNIYLPIPSP